MYNAFNGFAMVTVMLTFHGRKGAKNFGYFLFKNRSKKNS